jgi:hypothetical protein
MAASEPTRPEIGLGVCRRGVEGIADRSLEAIAAAVARCDYELAATTVIACGTVPIEVAMTVLPGIELPSITCALIACATGDRTKLVEILEHRRFPQTRENGELEAIVLYAAWLAGAPRERVLPELRRLSARSMFADGFALLSAMVRKLDDPNAAMAAKHVATFADEYAKEVAATGKALAAPLADVIAGLPPDVQVAAGAVGFTVRAEKEPGRNDPCPCGSGLKYKKCHADKPVTAGSPVPGVSWDAFLTTNADQMTVEHVEALPLRDLARVSVENLLPLPLATAVRMFVIARQWRHAEAAIDALVAKDAAAGDEARDLLIQEALWCRETELAHAHIAKLPADLAPIYALDLSTDLWRDIEAAAEKAVVDDHRVAYVELAQSLLRVSPSLGILAARACIGAWKVDDAELLLESVEEVRDQLGLPPGDPAWDVVDSIAAKKKTKRRGNKDEESDESKALRVSLQESAARADELERSLAAIRTQLDDARTLPAAALARKTENRTGLETKIEELEALIREGNAERRDLRKALAASQEVDEAKPAAPAEPDEPGESLPETARGITIPRFDRRFTDSLDEVPQPVAAESMRTIGNLCAGDGFAWLGVKQAKDMAKQVLMARVGIHHRLLFRADAGMLDVLELVTREQLLATLKRIRNNRT